MGILPEAFLLGLGLLTLLVGLYDFDLLELVFGVESGYLGWRGHVGKVFYVLPPTIGFLWGAISLGILEVGLLEVGLTLSFLASALFYATPPPVGRMFEGTRNKLELAWHDILSNRQTREKDLILLWGMVRIPYYRLGGAGRIITALFPYYVGLLLLYLSLSILESRLVLAIMLTVFVAVVAFIREGPWSPEEDGEGARGLGRMEELQGAVEGTLVSGLTRPLGAALLVPFLFLAILVLYVPASTATDLYYGFRQGYLDAIRIAVHSQGMAYWLGGLMVPFLYMWDSFRVLSAEQASFVGRPYVHLAGSAIVVYLWTAPVFLSGTWPFTLLPWFLPPVLLLGMLVFLSYWIHRLVGHRSRAGTSVVVILLAFGVFLTYQLGTVISDLSSLWFLFAAIAVLGALVWVLDHLQGEMEELMEEWDEDEGEGTGMLLGIGAGLFLGYGVYVGYMYRAGQMDLLTWTNGFMAVLFLLLFGLGVLARLEGDRQRRVGWILFGMKEQSSRQDGYLAAFERRSGLDFEAEDV